jgi:hypothetical protein
MIAELMTALSGWRFFAALAVLGAVIGAAYGFGHHVGFLELKADWDAQQIRQNNDYEARLREQADDLGNRILMLTQRQEDYEDRLRTVGRQRDAALAGLRDRPERPAVPASGAGAEACQGATGTSLSRSDAEFLVGEASRADELRAALERCQGGDVAQDGGRLDH